MENVNFFNVSVLVTILVVAFIIISCLLAIKNNIEFYFNTLDKEIKAIAENVTNVSSGTKRTEAIVDAINQRTKAHFVIKKKNEEAKKENKTKNNINNKNVKGSQYAKNKKPTQKSSNQVSSNITTINTSV